MEKRTHKGQGRSGNIKTSNHVATKTERVFSNSDGDRQVGGTGLEASGNADREGETDYSGLVEIVKTHNEKVRADIINRAWHPEATEGANIQTIISDVPVLEGKAAYQLSTGVIIEV